MDRLERLVNLVAALLDTRRPLTREEIHARIDGYSDDPDAFRRNFERDKEVLRQMGLPLATEQLDPNHPEHVGYRIPREEYELPDPGLDEDELAALRLASAAVQIDGAGGRQATVRALRKLAGAATGASGDAPLPPEPAGARLAALPGGEAVAAAFGAVAARRRVRFAYRGETRLVDPWRLSFRRGQWYLSGLDHLRGEERLFRLDRVEGVMVAEGPPDAFARPAGGDAGPPPAWRIGDDDEVVAELLVDADQARWALDALGPDAVAERRPDGGIVFSLAVTNVAAFRSFVLGFLDHAEILGPPRLRVGMLAWLADLADEAGRDEAGGAPAGANEDRADA
ncbi:MAG TPA: WYL domain-containing protein [Acidimicrobiales bacterium]|jgi:predicted DNA-binding transcriptional regulator YafY